MTVTPQEDDLGAGPDPDFDTEEVDLGAAPEDEAEVDPIEDNDDTVEDEGSTEERIHINAEELGGHYVTVKVDGKDVEMTLKEALQATMRQADYTRKTQEVAAERERLASFARLAEALEEDPAGTIAVLQKALGVGGAAAVVEELEELDPTEARLQRIERLAEQQEQETRNRQHIASAEEAIRSTEGLESDAGELLKFAIDNNILDLSRAAHFLLLEKGPAKPKAPVVDLEAAKQRKRAAAVVEGGRSRAATSSVPAAVKKMSLREAYEAAKAVQSK